MNYRIVLLLLATAIVALSWSSAPAVAGDGYSYGYGFGYVPYSIYSQDRIPYFAQHPPVYYSYPVPRTYGYSPYAYPPSVMTPPAKPTMPITLDNPFVPKRVKVKEAIDRSTAAGRLPEPLVLVNPFVRQVSTIADTAK